MRNPHGTLLITLIGCAAIATAQPAVTAVVNAASFDPAVPRGCLVTIFGTKLAASSATASTLPLPKKLAGTMVTVGDLELEAPLYYVSSTQINAQIPFEALGSTLPVFVTTSEGKSAPFLVTPVIAGPGIFTQSGNGKGTALSLDSNFQPLTAAEAGKPMILYATGLGPTDPPALSGVPGANAEPLNRVVNLPDVFIGESPARVDFAGLAPGMVGLYQLNVVPPQLATDRIFIRSQGRTSNLVTVSSVTGGKNVAHASGTIQAIYPAANPPTMVQNSPLLLAAKFSARMDIPATAGKFVIAAVSDAATSIITVDPANGTYDGTVTVPTAASRVGDFSDAEFQPIDLLTCVGASCLPFPGGIVPASRISPLEIAALGNIPLPNTLAPHSSTGVLKVPGTVRPGATFAIDDQNNSSLSIFAGYLTIPVPPKSGTTALKLYIDGTLVASRDVAYRAVTF
jgi:uncharacterized protein (TIGR03437 family)